LVSGREFLLAPRLYQDGKDARDDQDGAAFSCGKGLRIVGRFLNRPWALNNDALHQVL
jgi:hypothetical protein